MNLTQTLITRPTKNWQMFKKVFKYDDPNELRDALMDADEKEYDKFLNDLKIKQNVLNKQIETKIGVERTRLENLVNAIKNFLDYVARQCSNALIGVEMPDLESEESAEQKRNQRRQGFKILTTTKFLVHYQFL